MRRVTMLAVGLGLLTFLPAVEAEAGSAPEISAAKWYNTQPLKLQALRGKIVVVEFWATTPPSGRAFMLHLNKLHHRYKQQGVVIIGLSGERPSAVAPLVKRTKAAYAIGAGSPSSRAYGVQNTPHAFVIDQTGGIVWSGRPRELGRALAAALARKPAAETQPQSEPTDGPGDETPVTPPDPGRRPAAPAASSLPSPATRANPAPKYAREGTAVVEYKRVRAGRPLQLHFYLPRRTDPSRALPAIVFFPGGGWSRCKVSQFTPHAQYFASRGLVAAVAAYRVKSTHSSSDIFDCVADAKSAIRWVRTHARELGVDPDKIIAGGGSAGGHVAACAGLVPGLEEAGENTSVSSRPNYLVLFNPVLAFKPNGAVNRRYKERANAINPSAHVRRGAPPTVIFHGTRDTVAPFANVERFAGLMKAAGNHCVLHRYRGRGHGFFNHPSANYAPTVQQADRFLAGLGLLSGEPTVTGATKKAPPAKTPARPRKKKARR